MSDFHYKTNYEFSKFPTPVVPTTSPTYKLFRAFLFTIVSFVVIIASPYQIFLYLFSSSQRKIIDDILKKAKQKSIKYSSTFKDEFLLDRIWKSPIGKLYADALEYQAHEGYCGAATKRTVLRSITGLRENSIELPPMKVGPLTLEILAKRIDEATKKNTKSTPVYASEGYDTFLSAIKKINDPNYRVMANFLRSPLFEFQRPWWLPVNLVLGLFGGHFSPCVGYMEDLNLVAIFDVNHNYSTFLVDAKRLYDAVSTYDRTTNKSRGLVVVEILKQEHSSGRILV